MAVRKEPFDNLLDLFTGISDKFDEWIVTFHQQIADLQNFISSDTAVGNALSALLSQGPLAQILQDRTGVLKIDDNAYGIPKLIYMEEGRIPENHKTFVGAKAIYNNYYFPDSPAIQNDFKGQYIDRLGWRIPFSLANYQQTKINPYFEILDTKGKFTSMNWIQEKKSATTDTEEQKPFDTNITEEEI